MLFRRFYDENLAQASYMLACERTREAIIVDPSADIGHYTRAAGADRVKIRHVTETHIHADFLSGAAALAAASGATLHLSGEGDKRWGYDDAALRDANVLRDASIVEFGRVRLKAMHTPGHTPEHMTFMVFDLERGEDPVGAITGDFVFVGDVGRPDLLEKAAGAAGSMDASARELFRSIERFARLPDYLQIWPGHGAGSACGKALGSMPQSTLGYERLFNWAFAETSETAFVDKVLADQPIPPSYFAEMKRANRGTSDRSAVQAAKLLGVEELEAAIKAGATVVDTRTAQKFAAGHVPRTINIPLNKSFLNWSGALIPYDRDFYIVSDRDGNDEIREILNELCKIGLTRVRGIFPGSVVHDWKSRRGQLDQVPQLSPDEVARLRADGRVQIVDVRNPDEWRQGHLPGAIHLPLASLPARLGELDASAPIVLHCKGGGRSSIAASFLQSRGMSEISNLAGGFEAWAGEGREVETDGGDKSRRDKRKS